MTVNGQQYGNIQSSISDFEIFDRNFSYNPDTGKLFWKLPGKGRQLNKAVGKLNDQGYNVLMFNYRNYRVSRIAWLLSYGQWPSQNIDHINRIRSDDRLINLRDVSQSENILNCSTHWDSETGVKGVSRRLSGSYYVRKQGKLIGTYATIEAAQKAYNECE